jgi:hypothetical protein
MTTTSLSSPEGDGARRSEWDELLSSYDMAFVERDVHECLLIGQGASTGASEAQTAFRHLCETLGRWPTRAEMYTVYTERLVEVHRQLRGYLIDADWFHGWNQAYLLFIKVRHSPNLAELLASDPLAVLKKRFQEDAAKAEAERPALRLPQGATESPLVLCSFYQLQVMVEDKDAFMRGLLASTQATFHDESTSVPTTWELFNDFVAILLNTQQPVVLNVTSLVTFILDKVLGKKFVLVERQSDEKDEV